MLLDPNSTIIEIQENKIIQKFLIKHQRYNDQIIDEIKSNILNMINYKDYKIKLVKNCKFKNRPVWEYKVNLDKKLVFRVAYSIVGNTIIVFFLSTTLLKQDFTLEVSNYLSKNL